MSEELNISKNEAGIIMSWYCCYVDSMTGIVEKEDECLLKRLTQILNETSN